jgi:DNA-binding NarL/FixJ family response regulator
VLHSGNDGHSGAGTPFAEVVMDSLDPTIRIMMVDDHPLFRVGVAAVLATQADMEVVVECEDAEDAIRQFRKFQPDVTLMDLQLPGRSGIDAIRNIRGEFPSARIIVLTTFQGDMQAARALRAGAAGYLLKSTLRKDLLVAIRHVSKGHRYMPTEVARIVAEGAADNALTVRELQVLSQVASGCSNNQIAINMGISLETVKSHIKSILAKVEAKDRTEAVVIAMRRGYIDA